MLALPLLIGLGAPTLARADGGPPSQSGAIAEDGRADRIYTAQQASNSVFVLTASSMSLVAVLRVPSSPSALALDSVRHRVYVASDDAGLVSVFDTRTDRLTRVYSVGGHPAGLFLTGKGASLDITDGAAGTLSRLNLTAKGDTPAQLFDVGPATAPTALLSPGAAAQGGRATVWAHGFVPGESVTVSWGVQPIAHAVADARGVAMVGFPVPPKADLGNHLVVVQGQSKRSSSGLLDVVPAPPVRHVKKAPPRKRARATSLLTRIMAPSVTIPLSLPGAHSAPSKGTKVAKPSVPGLRWPARRPKAGQQTAPAGIRVPLIFLPIVLLLVAFMLFKIVRARRRAKATARAAKGPSRKGSKGAKGAAPLKKAS